MMRVLLMKLITALCFCVVLTFAAGCSFSREFINDPNLPANTTSLEVGSSTQQDLLELLGAPNSVIPLGESRNMFIYSFGNSKKAGLSLLIVSFSKTNKGLDTAVFILEDEIIADMYVSNNSEYIPWEWWSF